MRGLHFTLLALLGCAGTDTDTVDTEADGGTPTEVTWPMSDGRWEAHFASDTADFTECPISSYDQEDLRWAIDSASGLVYVLTHGDDGAFELAVDVMGGGRFDCVLVDDVSFTCDTSIDGQVGSWDGDFGTTGTAAGTVTNELELDNTGTPAACTLTYVFGLVHVGR